MKKKEIEVPEPTDFSLQAFKKRQRELAYLRVENAYLKKLEALDRQKQRQKKERALKLYRDFTAAHLNRKWVSDMTEFQIGQEKIYFSPLVDLANRETIEYNFSIRLKFSLVKRMLE